METDLERRAGRHAALGDPLRLRIVDTLTTTDATPSELQDRFAIASNLLAHHLDVLEQAGLVSRSHSSGDGRRRYVHLRDGALAELLSPRRPEPGAVLFVCTANSARSQLAAALWRRLAHSPAESAGTHPAAAVAPGAVAAARRHGLDLSGARPRRLDEIARLPRCVVTVCDRAHEELEPGPGWLHWSVPDPVAEGTKRAFDTAVADLERRVLTLLPPDRPTPRAGMP